MKFDTAILLTLLKERGDSSVTPCLPRIVVRKGRNRDRNRARLFRTQTELRCRMNVLMLLNDFLH